MSDDFKVQLSIKKGEGMLNIRAENANEFHALYEELRQLAELGGYLPSAGSGVQSPRPLATVAEAPAEVAVEPEPAPDPAPKDPLAAAREKAKARMKGAK